MGQGRSLKRDFKKYTGLDKNENTKIKYVGSIKSNNEREVFSTKFLL